MDQICSGFFVGSYRPNLGHNPMLERSVSIYIEKTHNACDFHILPQESVPSSSLLKVAISESTC
jgi:hypothetical protein